MEELRVAIVSSPDPSLKNILDQLPMDKIARDLSKAPNAVRFYFGIGASDVEDYSVGIIPIKKEIKTEDSGIKLFTCFYAWKQYRCTVPDSSVSSHYQATYASLESFFSDNLILKSEELLPDVSVGYARIRQGGEPFYTVRGHYISSDRVLDVLSRYFSYLSTKSPWFWKWESTLLEKKEEDIIKESRDALVEEVRQLFLRVKDKERQEMLFDRFVRVISTAALAGKLAKQILSTPDETNVKMLKLDFSLGSCLLLFDKDLCFDTLSKELYSAVSKWKKYTPEAFSVVAVENEDEEYDNDEEGLATYGAIKLKDGFCVFEIYEESEDIPPYLTTYCIIKSPESTHP